MAKYNNDFKVIQEPVGNSFVATKKASDDLKITTLQNNNYVI